MATRSCPFNPGDHVWGYGRDSGGIEQQESVASQRRAIEKYCRQNNLVLVHFLPTKPGSALPPWGATASKTCCTWPGGSLVR
jgi:hypothetical protein